MKNSFKIFTVVAVSLAMISSCAKTQEDNEVYVDSYINCIFNRNGVPVYSVMHTAYTFSRVVRPSSISVSGTSSSAITLTDYSNQGYSFFTPVGDSTSYKVLIPPPENFTYNITYSGGDPFVRTNSIVAKSLMPAKKLKTIRTPACPEPPTNITLSCKAVANAEAYKIGVYRNDTLRNVFPVQTVSTLLFESDFLEPKDATSDLSFPFLLNTFPANDLDADHALKNFSFSVSAFIFEQDHNTFHAVSAATIQKDIFEKCLKE